MSNDKVAATGLAADEINRNAQYLKDLQASGSEVKTYWNGEPAQAVWGTAIVEPWENVPMFWGKHLIGKRVPVVQVTTQRAEQEADVSSTTTIQYLYDDNHSWLGAGSAWRKVTFGKGTPQYGHLNLRAKDFWPFGADPGTRPDTLPCWLFYRFASGRGYVPRKGDEGALWNKLEPEDQEFWKHEAEAVRRAVERGGFK